MAKLQKSKTKTGSKDNYRRNCFDDSNKIFKILSENHSRGKKKVWKKVAKKKNVETIVDGTLFRDAMLNVKEEIIKLEMKTYKRQIKMETNDIVKTEDTYDISEENNNHGNNTWSELNFDRSVVFEDSPKSKKYKSECSNVSEVETGEIGNKFGIETVTDVYSENNNWENSIQTEIYEESSTSETNNQGFFGNNSGSVVNSDRNVVFVNSPKGKKYKSECMTVSEDEPREFGNKFTDKTCSNGYSWYNNFENSVKTEIYEESSTSDSEASDVNMSEWNERRSYFKEVKIDRTIKIIEETLIKKGVKVDVLSDRYLVVSNTELPQSQCKIGTEIAHPSQSDKGGKIECDKQVKHAAQIDTDLKLNSVLTSQKKNFEEVRRGSLFVSPCIFPVHLPYLEGAENVENKVDIKTNCHHPTTTVPVNELCNPVVSFGKIDFNNVESRSTNKTNKDEDISLHTSKQISDCEDVSKDLHNLYFERAQEITNCEAVSSVKCISRIDGDHQKSVADFNMEFNSSEILPDYHSPFEFTENVTLVDLRPNKTLIEKENPISSMEKKTSAQFVTLDNSLSCINESDMLLDVFHEVDVKKPPSLFPISSPLIPSYTSGTKKPLEECSAKRNNDKLETIRPCPSVFLLTDLRRSVSRSLLTPITRGMGQFITSSLTTIKRIVLTRHNIDIRKRDLFTLKGSQWLNDNVIELYLTMIAERSVGTWAGNMGFPRVHCMSTYFYPNLVSRGFESVVKWSKGIDLFNYDILLVPVHIQRRHWALAVVDLSESRLAYYDSLGGVGPEVLTDLMDYLQKESKVRLGENLSSFSSEPSAPCPRQENTTDCGVFVCKVAEFISRREDLSFIQEDIPYYRKRLIWEIVKNKLLFP